MFPDPDFVSKPPVTFDFVKKLENFCSEMSVAVDLELKKAFSEMQSKMVDSKQKMRLADLQIESLKRTLTHSGLTVHEIEALPAETRVYESVGRMFILSSRSEVTDGLSGKQKSCREKIKTLESNKEYLDRSLKESENGLRELILQKRAA